jgi:hypothetical protein
MATNGLGIEADRLPADPETLDHCLRATKWLKLT